ncbi:MAG TPA: site-specific DNA-methyltransferase [Flavobacteriales bacterium]|nr:site-specific DNA-methyltransferase [Flavobacteriales bacterium]
MPTLHWIGKDKVINHHREVPFKVLEHGYGFSAEKGRTKEATGSGNMVIHGDNLEALKALLPRYEGRVKCIYIDPPYNTGNEGWVYNDNVNDPRIRRWLNQVVGKEGEDLSRHDKWLCMMYPRLVLLHKLLAEDGVIFISIDDNAIAQLKFLCEEIFGTYNFIANIVWQKRTSPDARLNLGPAHDYILVFAKQKSEFKLNLVPFSDDRAAAYRNPDNDPRGPWASVDITGQTGHATASQFYAITSPSGRKMSPPDGRCWAMAESTFLKLNSEGRIWFGANGTSRPRLKKFLAETEGTTTWTWWPNTEVGHNQEAAKELAEVLGSAGQFDTPKPSRLVHRILQLATDKNAIILDSFAGSGTTAHAVLNLNKQDGGNRKFILVEMEDYAETITAERVKRVMQGFGTGTKAVDGTGGSFDFYTLGPRLFDEQHNLNEEVGVERIREYVWYTETRTELGGKAPSKASSDTPYLLGTHDGTAYYFIYEQDRLTVLDYDTLALLRTKAEHYVIYADNCILPQSFLEAHHITFKKIPRDISRF